MFDGPACEVPQEERRHELRVFLFLTVVQAPLFLITLIGSYGLLIWIYQMFAGPPGPPV